MDGETNLAYEMIAAISDLDGTSVTDTKRTLYDYVDPEALERAFRSRSDPEVTFWVDEYMIVLDPYESITVFDRSSED